MMCVLLKQVPMRFLVTAKLVSTCIFPMSRAKLGFQVGCPFSPRKQEFHFFSEQNYVGS
jgi:hypothetical protein